MVGDILDTPSAAAARPAFYFPYAQMPIPEMILALATAGEPRALVESVRHAVLRLDPELPVADVRTLAEIATSATAARRFLLSLVTAFAATALFLAAIGIYGVMSAAVGQRQHEFGIRMALGATPAELTRMVVVQGMILAAAGLALGLGGAVVAAPGLRTLLFGVTPGDPITMMVAVVVLAATALSAGSIRARRAAAVEPAILLRHE